MVLMQEKEKEYVPQLTANDISGVRPSDLGQYTLCQGII